MYNEIVRSSVPNLPVRIGYSGSSQKRQICENHFHDEIEILAVDRGKMSCTSDGKTISFSSGDVVFLNSRVPHYTAVLEDNTKSILLQIDVHSLHQNNMAKYLFRFISSSDNRIILFPRGENATAEMWRYLNIIKDEYAAKAQAYETYIRANIYNILALLYRNNILKDINSFFDMKEVDRIVPALAYIDAHYAEDITLETISGTVNLDPSYFCRLFKRITNITFKEYLNFVRVCHAERLLSRSSKSMLEIAFETGFSSVSYFSTVFRRIKDCTPSDYRKIKYAHA